MMISYEFRLLETLEEKQEALILVKEHHYTNTAPRNSKYVFGLFDNHKLIGVCLFGRFSRLEAGRRYNGCLELTRLYIIDNTPKNTESFFIGKCLRWLKKNSDIKGIISYCDPNAGHHGVIYQASNFVRLGYTKRSYHYLRNADGKRVHIRAVWDRAVLNSVKERTQAKREGLTRIEDEAKIVYFYSLRKGFEIQELKKNNVFQERNQRRLAFFSKWTRESAWVYGLILGDGCVHKSHKTNRVLFFGNKSTVDNFCRLLEITRKFPKNNSGFHVHMDGKDLVNWFESRGICGRKSHTITWPDDLPEKYTYDFLRGLIDTDGMVTIEYPKTKGRPKLSIGYSSASKLFVQQVRDKIGSQRKITESTKIMNGKVFKSYFFKIGAEDSVLLGDNIYKDSDGLRNDERWAIYQEGKRLYEATKIGCYICGRPIHTRNVCTEHMWEEKKANKPIIPCRICGIPSKFGDLCGPDYYREIRKAKAAAEGRVLIPRARRDGTQCAGVTSIDVNIVVRQPLDYIEFVFKKNE